MGTTLHTVTLCSATQRSRCYVYRRWHFVLQHSAAGVMFTDGDTLFCNTAQQALCLQTVTLCSATQRSRRYVYRRWHFVLQHSVAGVMFTDGDTLFCNTAQQALCLQTVTLCSATQRSRCYARVHVRSNLQAREKTQLHVHWLSFGHCQGLANFAPCTWKCLVCRPFILGGTQWRLDGFCLTKHVLRWPVIPSLGSDTVGQVHHFAHLVWPESLFEVGVLEEARDGKHIGAGVHHDEEEGARQVEPRQAWVVLHHQEQQRGHLLHQHWVECQQQLQQQWPHCTNLTSQQYC